jgi:hypothetical protein
MPNLAQLFANCNAASYYSRTPGEIYAKLNEAGFEVYTAVIKEFKGFFIKFDESSLTLTASQSNQEYTLPTDLTQIVHMAERTTSTEDWHPMYPSGDLENVLINQLVNAGILSFSMGNASPFEYFGPFLDSAATTGTQTQKIRIAPIPDQNHSAQLVYTAKWVQVTNDHSSVMLPDEGTYAMEAKATAKLLRLNNDGLYKDFVAEGQSLETKFLTWMRQRQIQEPPTAKPFLSEYM